MKRSPASSSLPNAVTVPYSPNNQPLFRYLLLASLLHGLALFCLQMRTHPSLPTPSQTLQLNLVPRPKLAETHPTPPAEPNQATGGPRTLPSSRPQPAPESIVTTPSPVEKTPPISAETLVESARRQIHEESRQRTAGPFAVPPSFPAEAPPSPLAKAMARRPAGEKVLGGGIVQVRTAAGSVYCLQAPPKGNDGSLNEALAVPTTCP